MLFEVQQHLWHLADILLLLVLRERSQVSSVG